MRAVMLCIALAFAACERQPSKGQVFAARMDTANKVRNIVGLLVSVYAGDYPMKDGALDVYALVRKGEIGKAQYDLLRKGGVPTDEEIEKGDYTRFPYERYRGDGKPGVLRVVPLVWDKEPDREGVYVAGMSDGGFRMMDRAELDQALGK